MSFGKEKSQKPRLVVVSSNGSVEKPVVAPSVAVKHLAYSQVIKSEDLRNIENSAVKIDQFVPSEVVGKRAAVLPAAARSTSSSQSRSAVDGLKSNLKTLNDLQARLRFMLVELEDLVQKS
jgi:hypothetical protein